MTYEKKIAWILKILHQNKHNSIFSCVLWNALVCTDRIRNARLAWALCWVYSCTEWGSERAELGQNRQRLLQVQTSTPGGGKSCFLQQSHFSGVSEWGLMSSPLSSTADDTSTPGSTRRSDEETKHNKLPRPGLSLPPHSILNKAGIKIV